jgi:YihY family inner membrane protein
MAFHQRLDAFQRRHRVLGFPIAVIYKFGDDQGNYLAALMTYYAFLSLFPLLLMASSILGFVLQGNPELQDQILDTALSQFPVIGDQLARPGGLQGSTIAIVVGALGVLYGAMGVAQATQNAMNIAWSVPRNSRPNPILARVRSMMLLATAGVGILVTTFVTTLGSDIDALETRIEPTLRAVLTGLTIAVNAAVFVLLYRLATTHRHSLRVSVPGAVTCALLWQLLQMLGTTYVTHVIKNASFANSIFAAVIGMIAYIYLGALCVVLGAEVNVVKAHRLWPRALLTPFTDNVDLTKADRRAYADYAAAQRTKGFEKVDVRFEYDGQYATAQRQARDNGDDDPPADDPDTHTDRTSGRPHHHH